MLILVAYDVSTETPAGRRRLRRVAKVCQDYGQRVQKSIFECKVNATTYAILEKRLLEEINNREDSLRLYRLIEPLEQDIKEFGCFCTINFDDSLVI